jgi:iron(III) transport system substrate-binding protein
MQQLQLVASALLSALVAVACTAAPAPPPTTAAAPKQATAKRPSSLAELSVYDGPDRQQILEEGARKEGSLLLYTSSVDAARRPITEAFMRKYSFIKVDTFRASNEELLPRMLEEFKANRNTFDVIETTSDSLDPLISGGLLHTYKSPEFAAYPPGSLDPKGYFAPVRESYVGLGFNTKVLNRDEVPKTLDDLLDPRWKGKMAIAGSSTGIRFVGNVVLTSGVDFLKRLGAQDVRVQKISGRAMADLIIAGEVPLSPTIFDSHVAASKVQNAPIDWVPLEPTVVNLGVAGVAAKGPHPHAALLFTDFLLSQDGQKIYMDNGYGSARIGMGTTVTNFKKRYLENDVPDYVDAFDKWQKLLNSTFIKA